VPDTVYCERLGDEAVLLDLGGGVYFGLDSVGARLWDLIATLLDTERVVEQALAEFDVGRAVLEADVDAFARKLIDKGLLTSGA